MRNGVFLTDLKPFMLCIFGVGWIRMGKDIMRFNTNGLDRRRFHGFGLAGLDRMGLGRDGEGKDIGEGII